MGEGITIVSPELTPTRGGLADYTKQVIAHWPGPENIVTLVPRARNREALRESLTRVGGAVLVQYSAYGFDRYGYPRWLIDGLIDWKERSRGRLVLMFHEIWTFWPWWNKNFVVQVLHRRAVRRLLRIADAVFTTTESQAGYLSGLTPGIEVRVLPVGSNILPQKLADTRTELGTAINFGMQGTRLKALREISGDLQRLAASKILRRIICVGGGNSESGDETEREILQSFPLSGGFAQLGSLPRSDVSELLSTAQFGIAAQDPLSYTKSGTLMAYAAHGLNILSPHARRAAPQPTSFFTSPAELLAGIAPDELQQRARGLQAWYERVASWPEIAQTLARAMQSSS